MVFTFSLPVYAVQTESVINVGVYDNPPLISTTERGQIEGIFADLIENIADKEGWNINYISGSFNELLSSLENKKIDLLPVVAYSDERAERLDFNQQNVLTNWAQIYTYKGSSINSLTDLAGKKIAVVKNDIHYTVFSQLMNRFGIYSEIIEVESYEQVFQLISSKSVSAGIVNRFFGNQFGNKYKVVKSGVVFNPIKIHFAVPKNTNSKLLQKIDQNLKILKNKESSMYYKSIDKWLGQPVLVSTVLPLLSAILLVLLLVVYLVYLLYQYQPVRKALGLARINTENVIFKVMLVTLFIAALFWGLISYLDFLWFNAEGLKLIDFILPMFDQNSLFYRLILVSTILLGGILVSHILLNVLTKQGLIKQSEQRFNLITRAGKTAMWDVDLKTNSIYLAPYLKQLLGYQDDEIKNEVGEWSKHVHPDDQQKVSVSVQQSLENPHKRFHVKHRLIHKDGSVRWFLANGSVVRDADGIALNIVGTHTDITDIKLVEQSLHDSEFRFRNLFENSEVSVWDEDLTEVFESLDQLKSEGITDLQLYINEHPEFVQSLLPKVKVNHVNRATLKLFKSHSESDFLKHIEKSFGAGALDVFTRSLFSYWEEKSYFRSEAIFLTMDGDEINAIISYRIPESKKEFLNIAVTIVNITDQKRAEKELKSSEQRFRKLFEVTDAISVQGYDKNRKVIYWNPASELLYGFSQDEAMGQQLEDLIIPDNMKEPVKKAVNDWLNEGIPIPSSELMLQKSDGSPVLVFSSHVMLENHNNEAEMFCIDIDLTESREVQLALKESEQRFDMAMEVVNDGIWDWSLSEEKLLLDSRFYTMAGYEPAAFPSDYEEWHKRLHVDDVKRVEQAVECYLADESDNFDVEFRFLRQEGNYMWVRARGKIVEHDADGKPKRFLGTHSDISLLKEHEQKILHQAHFDALTGLPNRLLTIDRLSQQLLEAERQQQKVAVLFMDLDDFKKVNDTLGHEIGDKLLIETAERLNNVVRTQDTVGRLGGDEFIILMGGVNDASGVLPVAENIINRLRDSFHIDGRELILSGSVGIALYPQDGLTSSELLRNADSAMYHAKKLGRNTYSFFTKEMNQQIFRRLEIEEQIHGALSRGEFSVFYQPKVEVSNSRIIGAEALIRWNNPALGSVSPVEFIPIAEQTGLILSIGNYVLSEALAKTAEWLSIIPDFTIAVNLSPAQFRDPVLVQNVDLALKRTGVSGKQLELEITEGVLMNSYAYVDEALSGLKALQVSISMDDFGTGYSSLSYLRNYPFDVLKIDKSFVRDITIDRADKELINAVVAMAHGLNLTVVAEGVEKVEQLEFLGQIGCDYAQGYLFSKPVPAHEFEELLK